MEKELIILQWLIQEEFLPKSFFGVVYDICIRRACAEISDKENIPNNWETLKQSLYSNYIAIKKEVKLKEE